MLFNDKSDLKAYLKKFEVTPEFSDFLDVIDDIPVSTEAINRFLIDNHFVVDLKRLESLYNDDEFQIFNKDSSHRAVYETFFRDCYFKLRKLWLHYYKHRAHEVLNQWSQKSGSNAQPSDDDCIIYFIACLFYILADRHFKLYCAEAPLPDKTSKATNIRQAIPKSIQPDSDQSAHEAETVENTMELSQQAPSQSLILNTAIRSDLTTLLLNYADNPFIIQYYRSHDFHVIDGLVSVLIKDRALAFKTGTNEEWGQITQEAQSDLMGVYNRGHTDKPGLERKIVKQSSGFYRLTKDTLSENSARLIAEMLDQMEDRKGLEIQGWACMDAMFVAIITLHSYIFHLNSDILLKQFRRQNQLQSLIEPLGSSDDLEMTIDKWRINLIDNLPRFENIRNSQQRMLNEAILSHAERRLYAYGQYQLQLAVRKKYLLKVFSKQLDTVKRNLNQFPLIFKTIYQLFERMMKVVGVQVPDIQVDRSFTDFAKSYFLLYYVMRMDSFLKLHNQDLTQVTEYMGLNKDVFQSTRGYVLKL